VFDPAPADAAVEETPAAESTPVSGDMSPPPVAVRAIDPALVDAITIAEPERRGGRPWIMLAGVAALVLIVGAGAFFVLSSNQTRGPEAANPPRQAAQPNPPSQAAPASPVAAAPASPVAAANSAARSQDPSVIYQADWSQGLSGWPGTFGWSAAAGVLRNDGSDFGGDNWDGGLWNAHWVAAPFTVPADITSYAVEAEIQVPSRPACGSFGLAARGSHQVGVHMCAADGATVLSIRSSAPELLSDSFIQIGEGWHLYRVEVQPETTRVLIDGTELAEVSDPDAEMDGPAGLWDDHTVIQVRQFRLRNLD